MEFRNRTKEKVNRDTEDELDVLLDPDHGRHPELAAEFPGGLLEEDNRGPFAAVETKILDPNTIVAAAAANIGIKNTTGVYDDSDYNNTIFTINPTSEA